MPAGALLFAGASPAVCKGGDGYGVRAIRYRNTFGIHTVPSRR
ncbi:hypothetical protein M2164_002664 [Streptomyces sp. SAI-208]|nr:hypothetical protein [Streptomyces sp. SAI-208]